MFQLKRKGTTSTLQRLVNFFLAKSVFIMCIFENTNIRGGKIEPFNISRFCKWNFKGVTMLTYLKVSSRFWKIYEGWTFKSGNYLFTTDAK